EPDLIAHGIQHRDGQPPSGVVGEQIKRRVADAQLTDKTELLVRILTILIHRLISEQIKTSTPVAPDRLAIRMHFGQVVERCRVVPGAESKFACVSAAAISTNAELTGAWLL